MVRPLPTYISPTLVREGTRLERLLASLLMGVGMGLRVAQYLGNRSLWGDEVAIALNLRLRTLVGLMHPLSYNQTMPLGLVVPLKLIGSVFGYSELVLRLPALLAGCALILVAWFLFMHLFEQRVNFLFVALLAISGPLIYYSAEVKQYGIDALVTVILMLLGFTALKSTTEREWPRLILSGAGVMLFSQPAVFVLTSIGACAALDRRFRTSRRWRECVVVAGVVWAIVFGLLYWFSYRSTMQNPFMRAFWDPKFVRVGSPNFRYELASTLSILLGASEISGVPTVLLGSLFLAGMVGVVRKHGGIIAVMVGGPFVLLLLAAALKKYPIAPRLVLFVFPILFWVYACGISVIADLIPEKYSTPAFVVLAGIFLLPAAAEVAWQARHYSQREGTRDVVRRIKAGSEPVTVYLVFGHYIQWEYYAGDWAHPELLKQRIDAAADCLYAAQLSYMKASDNRAGCDLEFHSTPGGGPEEIVGNSPPGPQSGPTADDQWARQEAIRIRRIRAPSIWLFLPDRAAHFSYGFPERRRLLEKLEDELKRGGCQVLEREVKGETRADKLQCSGA